MNIFHDKQKESVCEVLVICKLFATIAMILCLLAPIHSYASDHTGNNNLYVYKMISNDYFKSKMKEYNPGLPLSKQVETGTSLVGISGDTITLYKVDKDAKKEDLDKSKPKEAYLSKDVDKDGMAIFENLPDGRYYIVSDEKSGYKSTTALIDLPLRDNGNILSTLHIYLKSEKKYSPTVPSNRGNGGRQFVKIDGDNNKRVLEGAGFKLYKYSKGSDGILVPYRKDGRDYVVYSDSNGKFKVDSLEDGKYALVETVAPENEKYQFGRLNDPIEFVVNSGSIDQSPIIVENKPENELTTDTLDGGKQSSTKENISQESINEGGKTSLVNNPSVIKIPKTGDIFEMLFYLFGALVFSIGLILFIKEKDKEKLRQE